MVWTVTIDKKELIRWNWQSNDNCQVNWKIHWINKKYSELMVHNANKYSQQIVGQIYYTFSNCHLQSILDVWVHAKWTSVAILGCKTFVFTVSSILQEHFSKCPKSKIT